ncbi:F-box/kelch-repeat protein At3g23880-like [Vicia villosa]|uniref:F-box/kelch-repeat protein At3g23880-like n=1 Tax=Vicia villosa TaxID=3911 RepID=UPI00273B77CB|nr:F-box/kelch-repeat protein At3g23880-like [Vicia villosa]
MDETTAVTETLTTLSLPILPFEFVEEILCRLPVKLLLQLRCLCKSFDTLISDPKFIKKHLHISTACPRLLIFSDDDYSYELSYPLHFNFSVVTNNATQHYCPFKIHCPSILGSCDGMFCLKFNGSITLWNPSIQKLKTLPSLDARGRCGFPSYGFGFDTLINNYKVICVFPNIGSHAKSIAKIMVHTLGTNSWRMIAGEFPIPRIRSLKFVSGKLNWIASKFVVSFDLGNESYFLPPKLGGEVVNNRILEVLRGCLCIFVHSHMFTSVWMMKEYGNEETWTQLFRVSRTENPFFDLFAKPVWISDEDLVLTKREQTPASWKMNFAICNFRNSVFRIQIIQSMNGWCTPEVYIESLVSPCF